MNETMNSMLSWVAEKPTPPEWKAMIDLLVDEVEASRNLEEILYDSRRSKRTKYVVLHRPLRLR